MKRWICKLALACGLVAAYVLSLEALLALFFHLRQDYDAEMWKYARDLKQNVSDERGHIHLPSRNVKLMGTEVRTNALGFRNPETGPKRNGTYRIAVLGDSFTLGWGVDEQDTYVRRLENSLRAQCGGHVEVLNFGIGNYNTKQIHELLVRDVLPQNPDFILYGFYWNDAEPLQKEPDGFFARHSHLALFWRKVRVRLLHFGTKPNSYLDEYRSKFESGDWEAFEQALRSLHTSARSANVPFAVALLPELRAVDHPAIQETYGKVERLLRSEGVPSVNLLGKLARRDVQAYWVAKDDPHPNALAQGEIATLIRQGLWRHCPK